MDEVQSGPEGFSDLCNAIRLGPGPILGSSTGKAHQELAQPEGLGSHLVGGRHPVVGGDTKATGVQSLNSDRLTEEPVNSS